MTDVSTMLGYMIVRSALRVSSCALLREMANVLEDAGVTCVLVGEGAPHLVTDHDLAGALAAGLGTNTPIDAKCGALVLSLPTATRLLLDATVPLPGVGD